MSFVFWRIKFYPLWYILLLLLIHSFHIVDNQLFILLILYTWKKTKLNNKKNIMKYKNFETGY